MNKHLATMLMVTALLLGGCKNFTIFDGIVSIEQVGASITRQYVQLEKAGVITATQQAQAESIHEQYRQAMGVLAEALKATKAGQAGDVEGALRSAKLAILPLLKLITPLIAPVEQQKLTKQLTTATAQ